MAYFLIVIIPHTLVCGIILFPSPPVTAADILPTDDGGSA